MNRTFTTEAQRLHGGLAKVIDICGERTHRSGDHGGDGADPGACAEFQHPLAGDHLGMVE
jgi:hypothetical protein